MTDTPGRSAWRRSGLLFAVLLLLAAVLRFVSVYPLFTRYDPATIALQAFWILQDGHTPFFWPGQAFMGPHAAYLLAGLFTLFPPSMLVMNLAGWGLTLLTLAFTGLLAWRCFGSRTACLTLLLFVIPTRAMMYWSSQYHADYQLCFLFAPLAFWWCYEAVIRARQGRGVWWFLLGLGLFCGFIFWNNMAIGSFILIIFTALMFFIKRPRFTGVFLPFALGSLGGLLPIFIYNFQHEFLLLRQVHTQDADKILTVLESFINNALPYFWGFRQFMGKPLWWQALTVVFLLEITLAYCWFFSQVWRSRKRGGDPLPYFMFSGVILLHMAVTITSHFGRRLASGGHPIVYLTVLYAVAFTIPAAWLANLNSRRKLFVALVPFLWFFGVNWYATASYRQEFANVVQYRDFDRVQTFPDRDDPVTAFLTTQGLLQGYVWDHDYKIQSLRSIGQVTISHYYQEHYLPNALLVDSARHLFWVAHSHEFQKRMQQIGARYQEHIIHREVFDYKGKNRIALEEPIPIFYDFEQPAVREYRIRDVDVDASCNQINAHVLMDGYMDNLWTVPSEHIEGEWIECRFQQPRVINRLVFFPEDTGRNPRDFDVSGKLPSGEWVPLHKVRNGTATFWSAFRPYVKAVKPRMEVVLPNPIPIEALRLTFKSKNRDVLSLREIYLYAWEDAEASLYPDYEPEINQILEWIESLPENLVMMGDHWWMNTLARRGRRVSFISNHNVNNHGKKNPFLSGYLPEPFAAPVCLISRAAHVSANKAILQESGFQYTVKPFVAHSVFLIEPRTGEDGLCWNGLELARLSSLEKQTIPAYPSLSSLFDKVRPMQHIFGDAFRLEGMVLIPESDVSKLRMVIECTPLKPLPEQAYFFIHFLDTGGNILFQGDMRMATPYAANPQWLPGHRVLLDNKVNVPDDLPETVTLRLGIWMPDSGKRLLLDGTERNTLDYYPLSTHTFDLTTVPETHS